MTLYERLQVMVYKYTDMAKNSCNKNFRDTCISCISEIENFMMNLLIEECE